jgi:formate hydrogenlyase subunit 3/multisubunit Na+/H+ antiporter MnhD subunit
VPYGTFDLKIDPLSAFFLVPILAVCALCAVYAYEYLKPYRAKRPLGSVWFFYNTLVASMALVVTARNGVLFLTAWETMALASFFLVLFEHERADVRKAGWSYFVASHLGTAFLLILFLSLGQQTGSLDFARFAAIDPRAASLLFLLAVVGFGTKAGFFPLHVWLPEAHPAAPSHVSALMSGIMIKTGIYGLLRIYMALGPGPSWWGWLLIAIGVLSGVLGVLFALAQHDLKRRLGLGMLGRSLGLPLLAALGFAGALLHVLNHALFKSLLFLSAGAVAHATGTREIDHLGGLIKRMPWTAFCFLIGAAAICGLPPLNGFVSEFLIFLGAYGGAAGFAAPIAVPCLIAIAGLALIGGLAVACFTKAFGIVFLGEPRSEHANHAHETGWAMRAPMIILAAACAAIGLGSPWLIRFLGPVVGFEALPGISGPLLCVTSVGMGVIAAAVLLASLRAWLLCGRPVGETVTWDCGYAHPSARMQYTASSFAQPLTDLFRALLGTRKRFAPPTGFFPQSAELSTTTPDLASERIFGPVYEAIQRFFSKLRWTQHGHLQLYVLQIVLALLILLLWKL